MSRYLCPCCKGKGHVFSSLAALCPPYWIVGIFERNGDGSGITRQDCDNCEGTGFISDEDDDEEEDD